MIVVYSIENWFIDIVVVIPNRFKPDQEWNLQLIDQNQQVT